MRGSGLAVPAAALLFAATACFAHLTTRPFPNECTASVPLEAGGTSSTSCPAGSSIFSLWRMPHASPGIYTYMIKILTPKVGNGRALASFKPSFVAGWNLTYDLNANPDLQWVTYTAQPGNEVYDGWVLEFLAQVQLSCASGVSSTLAIDDPLVVPMGKHAGVNYYGLLLPTIQYFCTKQSDGICHPNGQSDVWTGYKYLPNSYNESSCGLAAATTGKCSSACLGGSAYSSSPCLAFQIDKSSSCSGNTTVAFTSSSSNWTQPLAFPAAVADTTTTTKPPTTNTTIPNSAPSPAAGGLLPSLFAVLAAAGSAAHFGSR